jgi:hypothetical protein
MSGIATAVIGSAVVGGVVGTIGANKAASATTDAANTNLQGTNATLAQQKDIYNQDVARNKPFYDTGVAANANLDKMVNGGYNMSESPAAQYELQQGTKSLNRQLAARGLLGSGNASQRLAELSSGVAASDYNNQYNRLLDQVKIGTGASASAGNAGNQMSNNLSNANAANSASNTAAGAGRAALYSGYGGLVNNTVSTGINAYGALSGNGAGMSSNGLNNSLDTGMSAANSTLAGSSFGGL